MDRFLLGSSLCAALLVPSLAAAAEKTAGPEQPFGLEKRVPWLTSRVVGTPEPPPAYRFERVFPKLKFKEPVCIAQEPGTDRFMVVEARGKVRSFSRDDADSAAPDVFLESKRTLSALSFHPRYAENGYVFVFSPQDPRDPPEKFVSRVSRYKAEGNPRRCLPESEEVLIEWPGGGHNGGEALIGPDGYLYIGTGDSTVGSDPKETGQGVDDLLSVMIRIDVDHPDPGKKYAIPKDNPFIGHPGARPEIWAFGFRNPWRMSFDAETGRLWVGDVGQDLWELIWVVERGGNYGWSVQEGNHPFHPNQKRGPGPILPPVIEHHHTECRSIVGGYVYHGDKFPELHGVYVYSDHEYGRVWGLRYDSTAHKVTWHSELADTTIKMPGFCVSRDGEIYTTDYYTGELFAMRRAPVVAANSDFPRRLSATGIFTSVRGHTVAPGLIPYSVNVAFWSDGTIKERFLGLPGRARIDIANLTGDDGSTWSFPDGTVLVKSFVLELEPGNPASRKRIETRLLVKQENHWLGYSYLWNDDETDAVLVGKGGLDRTFTIQDPSAEGGRRPQVYHYPSRSECMVCHSRAAGFALGLNTRQMNKVHDYGGVPDNQLRTLDHIGVFRQRLAKLPEDSPTIPDPFDDRASLESRARSYLHVNCAMCHVVDGGGNSRMQLRFTMTPTETQIYDVRPIHDTYGIPDPRLVAPAAPERSVLLYRMGKRGPNSGQMPPLSTHVVDRRGVQLIRDWIAQLKPEPAENQAKAAPRSE
jgi:uncharacterized repeat protein (TIGR03806 family)